MRKTIVTTGRAPFATVESEVFIDVLYGFGQEIEVDFMVLARWLSKQKARNMFVGRRLSRREVRLLREAQIDIADDVYGGFEGDLRRRRLGVTVP